MILDQNLPPTNQHRLTGLQEPPRRFFVAVYRRETDAVSMDVEPEVFFPMAVIKAVKMSQRREDEMVVVFELPKAKDQTKPGRTQELSFKPKTVSREVLAEALDILTREVLEMKEQEHTAAERAAKKKHFLKVSQASIAAHGCPSTAEDWMGWRDMMESQGADDDSIKDVYKDVALWINQNQIPQSWKQKHIGEDINKEGRKEFSGLLLRSISVQILLVVKLHRP